MSLVENPHSVPEAIVLRILQQADRYVDQGHDYEQAVRMSAEEYGVAATDLDAARQQRRIHDVDQARMEAFREEAERAAGAAMHGPTPALPFEGTFGDWERDELRARDAYDRRIRELCATHGVLLQEFLNHQRNSGPAEPMSTNLPDPPF